MTLSARFPGGYVVPPERPGWRKFGVPPGGPFDAELATIARAIAEAEVVIEISSPLRVEVGRPMRLGFAGPPDSQMVEGSERADIAAIDVMEPGALEIRAPRTGMRGYLAISELEKPWEAKPIGVAEGEAAAAKFDVLPFAGELESGEPILRVVESRLGPQAIRGRVGASMDRVGIRIQAGCEPLPALVRSEPSAFGAIQMTPSGELLIHGPDGPTLGGYPKAGFVCAADRSRLAQLRPDEEIELVAVSLEEAAELRTARGLMMDKVLAAVRAAYGLRPFPS